MFAVLEVIFERPLDAIFDTSFPLDVARRHLAEPGRMDGSAAKIFGLIDHQDAGAGILGFNGGSITGTARTNDDDVRLIVPSVRDTRRRCRALPESADADSGGRDRGTHGRLFDELPTLELVHPLVRRQRRALLLLL